MPTKNDTEEDKDSELQFFAIISVVLGALFVLFLCLWAFVRVDYSCNPENDKCAYGGVCNATTMMCDCTQYAQYPFCNPAYSYMWSSTSAYGFVAFLLLLIWIVAFFSFGYSTDRSYKTSDRVNTLLRNYEKLEKRLADVELHTNRYYEDIENLIQQVNGLRGRHPRPKSSTVSRPFPGSSAAE
ncbi:MAG: hypothetical protein MI810_07055, partial [Flavobacteriales bacterium]|nr:hypothetical protein [Flavobacteriales bacterium]